MGEKRYELTRACENGLIKTAKALINDPDVDPSYSDNWPIRTAAYYGRKEIVKLLLTDKRVVEKIDDAFELHKGWIGYGLLKTCVDEHKREEKERRIQEAIEEMSADCELYF